MVGSLMVQALAQVRDRWLILISVSYTTVM